MNTNVDSRNRKYKYEHVRDGLVLCVKCNKYKLNEFFDSNKERKYRDFCDTRCKKCKNDQRIKRNEFNRTLNTGNLERLLRSRFYGARQRSKDNNIEIDITVDYLLELWNLQNGKCSISKIDMTYEVHSGRIHTNVSIDRKDPEIGYLKTNIQLVCMAVNQMKSDMTNDDLLYFCKEILKNN